MGIQCIALEYQSYASVLRCQVGNILFSEKDFSGGWLLQTADQIQCGTFSTAGWSQQTNQLSIWNFKIKIINCNDISLFLLISIRELLCQILQKNSHILISSNSEQWDSVGQGTVLRPAAHSGTQNRPLSHTLSHTPHCFPPL